MRIRLTVLSVAWVFVAAPLGFAEPILITGGSVTIGSFSSNLAPPFGFDLIGDNTLLGGVTFAVRLGFAEVGEVINPSTGVFLTLTDTSGPCCQTVRGVQFNDVVIRGSLNFDASPFIVGSNLRQRFTVPFTATGDVSLFEGPFTSPGSLLATAPLTGRGTASIFLSRDHDDEPFRVSETFFRFTPETVNPVPEPATLALMCSGVAAATVRVRRRKN